jgi:hypothetical protein
MIFWVPLFPFALIFCSYCEMIPVRAFSDSNCNPAFSGRSTVLLGREKLHWVETEKVSYCDIPLSITFSAGFSSVWTGFRHYGFGSLDDMGYTMSRRPRGQNYIPHTILAIVIIITNISATAHLLSSDNVFHDEFSSAHLRFRLTCDETPLGGTSSEPSHTLSAPCFCQPLFERLRSTTLPFSHTTITTPISGPRRHTHRVLRLFSSRRLHAT